MRGWIRSFLQRVSAIARGILGKPAPQVFRRGIRPEVKPYVNRIVSDAILFNEIPSPTEKEEQRVAFITQRLNDFGVSNICVDEAGNVIALLPAFHPTDEYVLLFAEMENESYSPLESLVRLTRGRAEAKGIADNSLGVAALLVLGEYIQKNDIQYNKNLLLLFTNLTSSEAGFEALESFLHGWKGGIVCALYIVGLELGSIETRHLGNCKLTIRVQTGERSVFEPTGSPSAVAILSNIAFQLGSIRWDERNSTTVNVARIVAGTGYGYFPAEGFMELEIYSGDMNILEMTRNAVCATIHKIAQETGTSVQVKTGSLIPVGNAEINRSLVEALKKVHGELRLRSRSVSTPDKTAILHSFGIPALSVGISSGRKSFKEEYVDLAPIQTGFRQLILLLEEIDAIGSPTRK